MARPSTATILALAAYASGVFPMPVRPGLMGWWSPLRRGVLPLDGLRVTRSLRKMLPRYTIRVDTAFDAVLAACADPDRPGGCGATKETAPPAGTRGGPDPAPTRTSAAVAATPDSRQESSST